MNKTDINIRPETERDFEEIYRLIETAFKTAKVSDGDEQDFAVQLRNGQNYIPELALVAEYKGRLIGHIMLTKIQMQCLAGLFEALLLAPVSVLLEYRNQGIGSALINESTKRALEMGYAAVFLVGDPEYYKRFGFVETVQHGIKNVNGFEDKYVMVKELVPNTLKGKEGTISLC